MPIPNGESVLATFLNSKRGDWGGLPRIVNKTPDNHNLPWVRLTQLSAPSETEPVDHLIRFMIQVDIYPGKDGGRSEANELGGKIRELLRTMPGNTDDAVTTGVECIGDSSETDDALKPPVEYRSQTYYIWMH